MAVEHERRVRARITVTMYDDNEVDVKCEGDLQLCTTYMAVMKKFAELTTKMGDELGRLAGVRK